MKKWVQRTQKNTKNISAGSAMAYRKVCEQLGIKVSMSENDRSNILKRMNISNPTQQQKEDAKRRLLNNIMPSCLYLGPTNTNTENWLRIWRMTSWEKRSIPQNHCRSMSCTIQVEKPLRWQIQQQQECQMMVLPLQLWWRRKKEKNLTRKKI